MPRKHLPPPAASLMKSVRGVGYSTKTAIADLIDNSISADASCVWIRFDWDGTDSVISVRDDGIGMDSDEIDCAMTFGSRNPEEQREASQLGRFGLGLKTASLSQSARFAVIGKRTGEARVVRVWDLEEVASSNEWLCGDSLNDRERECAAALAESSSGTVVIWSRLDRLVGIVQHDDERARLDFQRVAREVEMHLAMTFHRFLEGPRPHLRIMMNGDSEEFRVRSWDPFCDHNPATQRLTEARRGMSGGTVAVQAYVLPHKDRLGDDYEGSGGPGGWIDQQGFYVYRNQRLLVSGSWLGLGQPKRWGREEQYKLARIRLDLPNTLDAEWNLDIKKSKAQPPLALRDWLTRHASEARRLARQVFVHRGSRARAAASSVFTPVWLVLPGDAPRYRINREHPLLKGVVDDLADRSRMEQALRVLESTVPVHRIWLDVAEQPEAPPPARGSIPSGEVQSIAADLLKRMQAGHSLTRAQAIERLKLIDPFDQFPEILASL